MNTGTHTETHSSHKASNASESNSQTYSTAPPTGAGFSSGQGGQQQPQQLQQQPYSGDGVGQGGLTNASGTGGNTGYTDSTPTSGYNANSQPQSGSYAKPGYGVQAASGRTAQGPGGATGAPIQSTNAGAYNSLPAQNTGSSATENTRSGTDTMGKHPNPTHVSNQYRPGTTYNTAPVAADGAQLHGGPPPAYKEGHNSSANLPEVHPRT